MFDIIPITVILIVTDFAFTGFILVLFGLSPAIKEIDKDKIIMCGNVSRVQFPTKSKWLGLRINNVAGIKFILTNDFLYVQDTILSYAVKVPVENMKEFSMMQIDLVGKAFGNRIEVKLASGESFRFRSKEIGSWQKALSSVGVFEPECIELQLR